jgi:hypothetical protein
MPINPRKAAGDLTGRPAEKLAEQQAAALADRAGHITTINPLPEVIPDELPEATMTSGRQQAVAKSATRRLRVNTDLDDVTIGQGKNFTFKRDQFYTVSEHVYNHLEEKGLVYH